MDHPVARFGRRSLVLLCSGSLWVLVGVGVLIGPPDRFSRPGPGDGVLEFMDHPNWGWMWLILGCVAMVSGLLRRKVKLLDEWGFNALLIPVGVWTLTYIWSGVTFVVTSGEFGQGRAWFAAVVYAVMALAVLVIAGWPEPADERAPQEGV